MLMFEERSELRDFRFASSVSRVRAVVVRAACWACRDGSAEAF